MAAKKPVKKVAPKSIKSKKMVSKGKPKQSEDDGKGMNRTSQDNSLGPFPQPSRFSGRPVNAKPGGSSYRSGGGLYTKITSRIGGGLKRGSK